MKNGSGAMATNRWVALAKIITPVQKMEQNRAAIKDTKKNHFMSMRVMGIERQKSFRNTDNSVAFIDLPD
jgi:hypothetical protein